MKGMMFLTGDLTMISWSRGNLCQLWTNGMMKYEVDGIWNYV